MTYTAPVNPARSSRRTARLSVGSCSACDAPVYGEDASVRMYGETFHYDCVFYRRLIPRRDAR